MSLYLNAEKTPMWAGWNSFLEASLQTMQKISYLAQIPESPTSTSVVQECLLRALRVMKETGKSSISVTMDLVIAKIASQIQVTETPKFDAIFINFGAFHIEMAYFHAIGKYIEESGGSYIFIEANILASGSENGFIRGKHYNRCKRLHPLLAAALQTLHLEQFLEISETKEEELALVKKELDDILKAGCLDTSTISKELSEIVEAYDTFFSQTLAGEHGLTGKYWLHYVHMVDLYHELSRSIRTGDFKLYVYCIIRTSLYSTSRTMPAG